MHILYFVMVVTLLFLSYFSVLISQSALNQKHIKDTKHNTYHTYHFCTLQSSKTKLFPGGHHLWCKLGTERFLGPECYQIQQNLWTVWLIYSPALGKAWGIPSPGMASHGPIWKRSTQCCILCYICYSCYQRNLNASLVGPRKIWNSCSCKIPMLVSLEELSLLRKGWSVGSFGKGLLGQENRLLFLLYRVYHM